jgi:hypothetical protein
VYVIVKQRLVSQKIVIEINVRGRRWQVSRSLLVPVELRFDFCAVRKYPGRQLRAFLFDRLALDIYALDIKIAVGIFVAAELDVTIGAARNGMPENHHVHL